MKKNFRYAILRKFCLWNKDIRIIMNEFNNQNKSQLEFLWTTWLKETKYPELINGFGGTHQIPRFANAIPDAYFR